MKILERKWNGILYDGQYGNYSVDTDLTNQGSDTLEMGRRAAMAHVLATNPETFEILSQNNINLFHGTNINALPNILIYGMNSFDELSKKGIAVVSINMDDKFYYIDDLEFVIYDKQAEEFIQGDKQKNPTTFGNADVKKMANERKSSGIKNI